MQGSRKELCLVHSGNNKMAPSSLGPRDGWGVAQRRWQGEQITQGLVDRGEVAEFYFGVMVSHRRD